MPRAALGLLGAHIIHSMSTRLRRERPEGGTTSGGSRVQSALRAWDTLSSFVSAGHKVTDWKQTGAGISGFVITILLVVLRSVFLRFPLHPLGFVMVMSYAAPIWGPFFIVWIIKSLVLRIGGMGRLSPPSFF